MSVLTISRFEWTRLFFTRRGWFSIAAFLLVWIMVLVYVIEPAARYMSSPEASGVLGMVLSSLGFQYLGNWSNIEVALYWLIALYLLPFFTLIIAADQFASDKARGTLRYLLLRTSRSELFLGRFFGQLLIQLLLVAVTLATVLALIALNSPARLDSALAASPVVLVNLALVLLPYVALMALVSVLANSARQATMLAIVAWIVVSLLLRFVQSKLGPIAFFDWVLPGSQISTLRGLSGWDTLRLAPIPLLHTVVLLSLGWFAMQRSDQ